MEQRLDEIEKCIKRLEGIEIIVPFSVADNVIKGSIKVSIKKVKLNFALEILPTYPFQIHETESIKFINADLLEYGHINRDGSVCIHTHHSPILEEKIEYDFNSLKEWIDKYFIHRKSDSHYEHIVVPEESINGLIPVFLFTEVKYQFNKGDFGVFRYSTIDTGSLGNENAITNVIVNFVPCRNTQEIFCEWQNTYRNFPKGEGIFHFIETPPVEKKRFAVLNWTELENFVSEEFLLFLHSMSESLDLEEKKPPHIPLLLGYYINKQEIHWQAIMIPTNNYPFYVEKVRGSNKKIGRCYNEKILWARTRNCSYKYFFGRGMLDKKLTDAKILIMGVGAIGSILATALVRGGIKDICLIDYDFKEPENVCRSDYFFSKGVQNKVDELGNTLSMISPFVEIRMNRKVGDFTKFALNDPDAKEHLVKYFNEYDIIFDCTTDNDVAYFLSQFETKGEIFNLSITNHAKEFVCVVKPHVYKRLFEIFKKLNNDVNDLYKPTGCWSPTFKASYTDIAVLVQYALKHINKCYEEKLPIRNFYLKAEFEKELNIKIKQF